MPINGGREADPPASKRRSVNLTIREDIIEAAKSLKVNASKAAEAGIAEAIREARGEQWLAENRAAIDAHNARMSRDGPLLMSDWARGYWRKPDPANAD